MALCAAALQRRLVQEASRRSLSTGSALDELNKVACTQRSAPGSSR
jgi:hypothetical protein